MNIRRWIAEKVLRVPVGIKIDLTCDEFSTDLWADKGSGPGWTLSASGGSSWKPPKQESVYGVDLVKRKGDA